MKYIQFAVQHYSPTQKKWLEFHGKYKSLSSASRDAEIGASKLSGRKFRIMKRLIEEIQVAEFQL